MRNRRLWFGSAALIGGVAVALGLAMRGAERSPGPEQVTVAQTEGEAKIQGTDPLPTIATPRAEPGTIRTPRPVRDDDTSGAIEPKALPEPARAWSDHDAEALTGTIDRMLADLWDEAGVEPADRASDSEFLRRVSLDLVGTIPTAAEARDFLDDPDPEKRLQLIERLIESPSYMARATEIWRSLLLPEADTDPQVRALAPSFEAWIRKKVDEDAGFDAIVREILALELGPRGRNGNPYSTDGEPTPLAFYIAKDAQPENLAAGASRVFLGIRLECAQCHDHPFAPWEQEQFWSFAAFFGGIGKVGPDDALGTVRELDGVRELAVPGTDRIVQAAFLDGSAPDWTGRPGSREALADWITAPENPYFARAAVNRIWARLFGAGLVEPVDDMEEDNPAVHPELLDELADQFRSHGYDLKFLIRALTATRAYNLTSAIGESQPYATGLFAAMPVRGLSPEQLFGALGRATGYREQDGGFFGDDSPRARFLELFAGVEERPTEAQTSILQALTLMNGSIVAGATDPGSGPTVAALAKAPFLDTAGRVDTLFLAVLTRRPRPDEAALLADYIDGGGVTGDPAEALADACWALINSPEFMLNH